MQVPGIYPLMVGSYVWPRAAGSEPSELPLPPLSWWVWASGLRVGASSSGPPPRAAIAGPRNISTAGEFGLVA